MPLTGGPQPGSRVLTIPNVLSMIRLILVPVFLYLLLFTHAYGWAVGILMFSGVSDWADGKIARLVANQSSRLGELLDPLVDRVYMLVVPVGLGLAGVVPWWVVALLIGRDAVLAATLPIVRSRGLTALPVTYIGKAATFALMSGFPLVLLGQWDALWSRVVGAIGWGFLIWGIGMYLWSGTLYLLQVRLVVRDLPQGTPCRRAPDPVLGGYDPRAGFAAHSANRPTRIPVPSLLRSLLSDHLDPGYAAAAAERSRSGVPADRSPTGFWQALAALLIAAVFAAAMAQARSTAPESAPRRARWRPTCGRPSPSPTA